LTIGREEHIMNDNELKMVTCYVKGPKSMWGSDPETGETVCYAPGEKIVLSENSALAKKDLLFTMKEYAAFKEEEAQALKDSEEKKAAEAEEREARRKAKKPMPVHKPLPKGKPATKKTKVKPKGADSKES
jgi:hypothetical protein